MNANPVNWFEIYVADLARARTFYENVLAVRLEKMNSPIAEMWAFPMSQDGPGAAGALIHMPGFSAGGNSTLVYFSCEDCAVEEGRVKNHGGSIKRPKTSIGEYGFITLAFDSEGNMFGLHSRK